DGILGIDMRNSGDRVPQNDRHHFLFDETDDAGKKRAMLELVAVETLDEFLARMHDDGAGDGHSSKPVDGSRIEFQRTLILQFLKDILFDFCDRSLSIDEVVVKDFF